MIPSKKIFLSSLYSARAISLFEIIFVLTLMSILSGVGYRSMKSIDDATRFKKTLTAMETMRSKIWGNPSLLQNGRRADFGYHALSLYEDWGAAGSYTDILTDIRDDHYWVSPEPTVSTHDAWGTGYIVSDGLSGCTITSYGADRVSGGTGFDTDIVMSMDDIVIESQNIRVYVVDRLGAVLTTTHISQVSLRSPPAVVSLTYSSQGYWYYAGASSYVCGNKGYLRVTAQIAYAEDLLGRSDANEFVETPIVIYPKDKFTAGEYNMYEVRFPGRINS